MARIPIVQPGQTPAVNVPAPVPRTGAAAIGRATANLGQVIQNVSQQFGQIEAEKALVEQRTRTLEIMTGAQAEVNRRIRESEDQDDPQNHPARAKVALLETMNEARKEVAGFEPRVQAFFDENALRFSFTTMNNAHKFSSAQFVSNTKARTEEFKLALERQAAEAPTDAERAKLGENFSAHVKALVPSVYSAEEAFTEIRSFHTNTATLAARNAMEADPDSFILAVTDGDPWYKGVMDPLKLDKLVTSAVKLSDRVQKAKEKQSQAEIDVDLTRIAKIALKNPGKAFDELLLLKDITPSSKFRATAQFIQERDNALKKEQRTTDPATLAQLKVQAIESKKDPMLFLAAHAQEVGSDDIDEFTNFVIGLHNARRNTTVDRLIDRINGRLSIKPIVGPALEQLPQFIRSEAINDFRRFVEDNPAASRAELDAAADAILLQSSIILRREITVRAPDIEPLLGMFQTPEAVLVGRKDGALTEAEANRLLYMHAFILYLKETEGGADGAETETSQPSDGFSLSNWWGRRLLGVKEPPKKVKGQ